MEGLGFKGTTRKRQGYLWASGRVHNSRKQGKRWQGTCVQMDSWHQKFKLESSIYTNSELISSVI